jgi:sugar phosphate isomerase/epimerase
MDTRYRIGVMQGRLLPKYMGRYQAHPLGYWQEEFAVARAFGLDFIEFILDHNDLELNPLMSEEGVRQIKALSDQTGVGVVSICADCFMEAPLSSPSPDVSARSIEVLRRLTQNAGPSLGVKDIVIPCVDQSSLRSDEEIERFAGNILPLAGLAADNGVRFSLETDLAPRPFADLLERLGSDTFSVNYDTGNSASLGYDVREEFAAYGKRITDVHIKDRVRGGGSVVLGTGDADFGTFFALLAHSGYDGPLIMQAYRDDEGLAVFKTQLEWLTRKLTLPV